MNTATDEQGRTAKAVGLLLRSAEEDLAALHAEKDRIEADIAKLEDVIDRAADLLDLLAVPDIDVTDPDTPRTVLVERILEAADRPLTTHDVTDRLRQFGRDVSEDNVEHTLQYLKREDRVAAAGGGAWTTAV